MTIFAISMTFLLSQMGKIVCLSGQSYVLQLKGVCLLCGNICSSITSVSYHFSISLCC